jgi:hypothetical protein
MYSDFERDFDALLEKTAELLTGESSPEMTEKVKIWAVYQHLHKTMPALTSHWNTAHPEGKAAIRSIFEEIRDLNQALKEKQQHPE